MGLWAEQLLASAVGVISSYPAVYLALFIFITVVRIYLFGTHSYLR